MSVTCRWPSMQIWEDIPQCTGKVLNSNDNLILGEPIWIQQLASERTKHNFLTAKARNYLSCRLDARNALRHVFYSASCVPRDTSPQSVRPHAWCLTRSHMLGKSNQEKVCTQVNVFTPPLSISAATECTFGKFPFHKVHVGRRNIQDSR